MEANFHCDLVRDALDFQFKAMRRRRFICIWARGVRNGLCALPQLDESWHFYVDAHHGEV